MSDLPKLRQDEHGRYYFEYSEVGTQEDAGGFLLPPLVLPCRLPDEAVGSLERWQMAIISEQTALKAERDTLAEALKEALTVGYFGDAQEAHSRLWDVLSTTQETDR